MTGLFDGFNTSIKRAGPKTAPENRANFTHPNADSLIQAAREALNLSPTGQTLLDYADQSGITITVLANKTEGGYSPNGKTAYLNVPAGQTSGTAAIIIQMAGALREAMQEELPELAPPSLQWGEHDFAQRHVDRDRDRLYYVCAVAYDLIHEQNMREIFDEMAKLGYDKMLEGYGKDRQESESNFSGEEAPGNGDNSDKQ